MSKWLFSILALSLLAGCNSDPYPKGTFTADPQPDLRPVRSAPGVDIADIISFEEGKENKFPIKASVSRGKPVISWSGLPDGASFNPLTSEFSWTPGFEAANDPSNVMIKSREYLVTLTVASDVDPVSVFNKSIILKVVDTPRPIKVSGGTTYSHSVYEGQSYEIARFTVSSDDFPQGPFRVISKNGIEGLKVVQGNHFDEWILTAGPYAYSRIKAGAGGGSTYEYLTEGFTFVAPDGRKSQEQSFNFYLYDQRQDAGIDLAKKIKTSGDLYVSFSTLDPNEEVAPLVRLRTAPAVGKFEIVSVEEVVASPYEARYAISWTNLPAEAFGKSYSFSLEVCNASMSSYTNHRNCRTHYYDAQVTNRVIPLPVISRGQWSSSALKYLMSKVPFSHSLSISAGNGASVLSTDVTSSDKKDSVYMAGSQLHITPEKSGIKFASVRVVNSLGGSHSETFLYEVLPQGWSRNLVLGQKGANAELEGLEANLKDYSREYFGKSHHNERSLAFRKQVIVGTGSFAFPDSQEEIAFFSGSVKDLLIATPRLKDLPESIISELRAQGVYLAGRGSDVAGFNLSDYEMVPHRDLGLPSKVVKLKGSTTAESSNPAFFSLLSSPCKSLFNLFKPGPTPSVLLTGVACPRSNGGQLVVLGFEWAELKFESSDVSLASQWFKRMMEK